MIYANILYWLALISGLLMAISYFPQAWKQLKNKSAYNIAITAFVAQLLARIIWALYGFQLHEFPIIISNAVGVIGLLAIVILYFIYRDK